MADMDKLGDGYAIKQLWIKCTSAECGAIMVKNRVFVLFNACCDTRSNNH